MRTFVIGVVFGKVPLEYKIVCKKLDMRTRFCKENAKWLVRDTEYLFRMIHKHNMSIKENRIIAPNGKAAYGFYKDLFYGYIRNLTFKM